MSVLLDTNILARLAQSTSSSHPIAKSAVDSLRRKGETLAIVPQCIYEFYVICTRPAGVPHNGLGLTPDEARTEITRARSLFIFLPDDPTVFQQWERLVVQHQVKGKTAHDARLVAAMISHGVRNLLTFNVVDFKRYPMINVIDAAQAGGYARRP